jgi:hypothetical protein
MADFLLGISFLISQVFPAVTNDFLFHPLQRMEGKGNHVVTPLIIRRRVYPRAINNYLIQQIIGSRITPSSSNHESSLLGLGQMVHES